MSAAEVPDGGRSEPEVVRATARAHERDRYLAALLARGQPRDDLLALVAFAAEIGRIGSLVSEPAMGEIRLQWWRDALRNPDPATKSGHPVADLTRAAVRRHGLPPGLLIGFIDAHAFDLYGDPLPDDTALASHLARTDGALFELALRVVGAAASDVPALAAAAGRAYGLARVLSRLPELWARGRTLLPATRLEAAGLSPRRPLPPDGGARLAPAASALAGEARSALAETRRLARPLFRAQRVAVLPVALVEPYLRAFEGGAGDPLRRIASLTPLQRSWLLLRAYWSGRL